MKELIHNLKFAWKYSRGKKKEVILYIITNLFNIGINILIPILSASIIIKLTNNEFYQLIILSLVIFMVENIRNIVCSLNSYYSEVIYRDSFNVLQVELGREILKLDNKCIDANGSGVFIDRMTGDTSRIADIFNGLNAYIMAIVMNVGIFAAIFIINWVVFIFVTIWTICLYLVEKYRVKKYYQADKIYRNEHEKVSTFVGEIVRGIRDIKMLNSEDSFISSLNSKVKKLNGIRYDSSSINRKYHFFAGFISDLGNLLLICLLAYLIMRGNLLITSALIIYNYSGRLSGITYSLSTLMNIIKDFNLSSSRIFAIINSDKFVKEKFGDKHLAKVKGDFEFKNVTFAYDKEKILDNINFKVYANETVAFVGKSGAGKSTIFSLLCKMYEVQDGEITIDGVNIKELDKESIRGNITIISQNPYIFNLSIKDNLRLVKQDVTDEEIIEACKLACLDEFIMQLPDKYDTLIGEGGVNLSGGQRQRLAIARAFIQKTEIILFDEATSALDNETQHEIQKAIDNMKKKYTILIIAHRLSTVINSDRILFLNDGKIECEGSHQELVHCSKEYKKLYEAEMK